MGVLSNSRRTAPARRSNRDLVPAPAGPGAEPPRERYRLVIRTRRSEHVFGAAYLSLRHAQARVSDAVRAHADDSLVALVVESSAQPEPHEPGDASAPASWRACKHWGPDVIARILDQARTSRAGSGAAPIRRSPAAAPDSTPVIVSESPVARFRTTDAPPLRPAPAPRPTRLRPTRVAISLSVTFALVLVSGWVAYRAPHMLGALVGAARERRELPIERTNFQGIPPAFEAPRPRARAAPPATGSPRGLFSDWYEQ